MTYINYYLLNNDYPFLFSWPMFDLHYLSNLLNHSTCLTPIIDQYTITLSSSFRLTNDWPVLFTSYISKTISLNEFERIASVYSLYRRWGCLRLFRIEEWTNEDPSGKDGWRVFVYLPFLHSSKRSYRSNKWRGSNSRYYILTHVFTQGARKFLGTLKSATSFAKVFARKGRRKFSLRFRFYDLHQVFFFFFFSWESKLDKWIKKIWKI